MANLDHLAILQEALAKDDISIWNQWREDNSDTLPPDLSKADLRSADLNKVDLRGINLWKAHLDEANLRGADLSGANLGESSLSGANLSGANLSGVDLWKADLGEADLRVANLSGADLTDTNFHWVRCSGTIFVNVDLSQVKNLNTVFHYSQSTIDIDTLERSNGNIPEIFLRGCGVSETVITFAKSLVTKPIDFYSCFISYSHNDKAFARQLHDRLQGAGIRCWLDEKQMVPGDDIYEEVERGIRYWDKVLLCCSESSLNSWWCDNEMDTAFNKERELFKERKGGRQVIALIPLDLDGYLFKDDYRSGKKQKLHSRLAANFKGWETDNRIFVEGVEQVIRALRTDGGKESPPEPKL